MIEILNFTSLLISIIGAIIAAGFYLEKRNKQKLDDLESRIERSQVIIRDNIIQELTFIPSIEDSDLPDLRIVDAQKYPLRKWNQTFK